MTHAPLPEACAAVWRDAGLGEFRLRRLTPSDLDAVAQALALGEGYTRTGAAPQTAQEIRSDLAGFGTVDGKEGLVVMRASDAPPLAFVLYLVRNKRTEAFTAGNILDRLPLEAFPADGRFLQIYDLWVDPSIRRRGVARALKRMLETEAASRQVRMIYTVTEARHRAVLELNATIGYVELYRGPMCDAVERVALARYLI